MHLVCIFLFAANLSFSNFQVSAATGKVWWEILKTFL